MVGPTSTWIKNTGVEFDFEHYLNIRIYPNYSEIEEVISTLKDGINYIKREGWKYSVVIERGATNIKVDIDSIIEMYKSNKNLGAISIFLWKM